MSSDSAAAPSEFKTVDIASALVRGSVSKAVAAGKTQTTSASKPRAPSKKKKAAAKEEEEEERDAEGVKSSGGVGALVLEKKAKVKKPKRKAADDDEEAEGSEEDEEDEKPKKKKKTAAGAAAAGASGEKAKRGASSVDYTKGKLTHQDERHEEYMKFTVDKLKHILNTNLISLPKPCTKDKLAWMCVYGEVLGAPPGLCARCGMGKLKPKIKKTDFGVVEVVKGKTKWTCPGFFDQELDSLSFCNKAYTDKEMHTVPFKGPDEITPEAEESAKNRMLKQRAKADELRHASQSEASSRASSPAPGEAAAAAAAGAGDGKKHHVHAQRLHTNEELESEMAKAAARLKRHPNGSDSDDDDDAQSTHAAADDEAMPAVDAELAGFITDSVAAPSQYAPAAAAAGSARKKDSPPPPAVAASSSSASSKPVCQYGAGCYRKNPAHLAEFSHPK